MNIKEQIRKYIASQPESKREDMELLHKNILKTIPGCKLWFEDGKHDDGNIVSNRNSGYGSYTIKYADARPDGQGGRGTTREFYQIGLSANTTGISVYILGIKDKTFLAKTYGKKLGKASVTGYCIKFKTINDINIDVLQDAIRHRVEKMK